MTNSKRIEEHGCIFRSTQMLQLCFGKLGFEKVRIEPKLPYLVIVNIYRINLPCHGLSVQTPQKLLKKEFFLYEILLIFNIICYNANVRGISYYLIGGVIMPKETFHNLKDEKKQRIFEAAVQEFASRKFSEASLNQIVKVAQIPWGSFYQYFDGKEDLYLYVIKEISRDKWDALEQAGAEDMDEDFFDTIRGKIGALFELGKRNADYAQIVLLQEMDDNEFIRKLRRGSTKRWKDIIERDKERSLIKPEVDADVMIDMFYNFVLLNYYRVGLDDEEKYLDTLDKAIKIMRDGVSAN